MAQYDYQCCTHEAGDIVTIERGMTEPEVLPICAECGKEMRRIFYAAPVKFNGSGFYSTGG